MAIVDLQRGVPDKGDHCYSLPSLLPCSLSLKSLFARFFAWLLQNTPCNFFTRSNLVLLWMAEDPSLEPLDLTCCLDLFCCLFIFISPSLSSTLVPNSNKPSTLFDISPYLNYPLRHLNATTAIVSRVDPRRRPYYGALDRSK